MAESLPLPSFKKPTWLEHRAELEAFAQSLDPAARLAVKRSKIWNVGSLRHFATTIGRTIYIPEAWTAAMVKEVLPHEVLGHVVQFRRASLGIHPSLGIFPGMFLVYIWGVVFPLFLAWGRYRCELHADTQSWRYHLDQGIWGPSQVRERAVQFAKVVASWAYIKPWPRRWVLWGFKRRAEQVIRGAIA